MLENTTQDIFRVMEIFSYLKNFRHFLGAFNWSKSVKSPSTAEN